MSRLRPAAAAGCVLLGVVTAVAAVLLHQAGWGWWLLALAAPLSVTLALPAGLLRVAYAAPFTVLAWLASFPRPEGDYLVTATPTGYGFLFGSLVLLGIAGLTMPRMKR